MNIGIATHRVKVGRFRRFSASKIVTWLVSPEISVYKAFICIDLVFEFQLYYIQLFLS